MATRRTRSTGPRFLVAERAEREAPADVFLEELAERLPFRRVLPRPDDELELRDDAPPRLPPDFLLEERFERDLPREDFLVAIRVLLVGR
ncbi:MAG: hypothetical protein ACREON_16310 [Gemmatimonadaceae bacterium]